MKLVLSFSMLLLPAIAGCPVSIKCSYHNYYSVPKVETEYRNGKEYGIYEHEYSEGGRKRTCKQVVECGR
jgi:hypothetical protein